MIAFGLAAIAVSGCAVTTAGVKPGDERNFVRSLNDINAGRAIKARLSRAEGFDLSKVNVEVAEGIVVLTGSASRDEDRLEAERIAWSAQDVVQVGNEIQLDENSGLLSATKDSFLNAAIRTRLTADSSVKGRNINIEAQDGIVYLLGVARTPQELERVAYIASTTKGTREVISYVVIPDAMMENVNYSAPSQIDGLNTSPYSSAPSGRRALPQGLQSEPAQPYGTPQSTPQAQRETDALQSSEPYYRDPKTGERIILPPGTVTVPYNPNAPTGDPGDAAHYIDPETGQQIPITYYRTR